MEAPLNPTPTPVAADKWERTVELFARQLGPPVLTPAGVPVEYATDAVWGRGESEVHLHKQEEGKELVPSGSSIFLTARTPEEFEALVGDFDCLGLKVKDKLMVLNEYRKSRLGEAVKVRTTRFASYYLNEARRNDDDELVGEADLCGAVDHNPPD